MKPTFDVNFDKIDIPFYLAYLPMKIPVKVTSGNLDVNAQLIYREGVEDQRMLSLAGEVAITKLVVQDMSNKPLLALPALNIAINSIEPFAGKVHLAKVSIESPEINLSRDKNGNLNIPGPDSEKQAIRKEQKPGKTDQEVENIEKKDESRSSGVSP